MVRRIINTFEEAEQYLNDMPRFTTKHSINETRAFLEKLGNPDNKMKIIHVAGTNGKGSTCAYLTSVLREAGFTTGLFTSPHLVDICERFNVNEFTATGSDMSHEEFLESFNEVYNSLDWDTLEKGEGYHPTYFEYLFFMGMLWFDKKNVEWCVLETGLGGLLDATNSVHNKEAAVIARIGLDHMQYLGETIAEIAGQKAGIIKKGVPVVYGDYVPEASEVFLKTIECENNGENNGLVFPAGRDMINILEKSTETVDFYIADGYYKNVSVCLDTIAAYQTENALLAIRTIEALNLCEIITPDILRRGLEKCHWAGRMEQLRRGVFIDGAHNPDGIRAFIETVSADGLRKSRRSLLFGVVADKNFSDMIGELVSSDLFSHIVITPLSSKRSAQIEQLTEVLDSFEGLSYSIAHDPAKGLRELIAATNTAENRIYVAGSLYLVGEIKQAFTEDDAAFFD